MKRQQIIIFIILFLVILVVGLFFLRIDSDDVFRDEKLKVIFFDIGQGDSAMIDAGNNIQILIDGGDGKDILNRLGKHLPFYDRKIELVIMTHPDKDHLGGLVEVLKYYEVEQVLETGIECEKAICKEWDRLIREKNITVRYAEFGQKIKAGKLEMFVLYPFENLEGQTIKNSNDASIVLKAVIKDRIVFNKTLSQSEIATILFTGDAGFPVEAELISKNIDLKAETLKVSHHGSKYATSNEFLRLVNPEQAIISVGKNSYGHPAEPLLNRLKNMNLEIFRTDKAGDIIFDY